MLDHETHTPISTEQDRTGTTGRNSAPVFLERQYVPSKTLQRNDVARPSKAGSLRKLSGTFRCNHSPSLPRSNAAVDLLVTVFCFAAVHYVYLGSLNFTSPRAVALFSSLVFIVLSLSAGDMYNTKRLRSLNRELTTLLLCWLCSFAVAGLFAFLTKTAAEVSRVWISSSMLLTLVSLASVRVLSSFGFLAQRHVRAKNVVMCGSAPNIKSAMHSLYELTPPRIRVAKIFEFSTAASEEVKANNSLKCPVTQIRKFVEDQRQSGTAIEQVWIALPANQSHTVSKLAEALVNSSVDVCVVPDEYIERILGGETSKYGQSNVVNISEVSLSPAAEQFKRIFDFFFALLALIIFFVPMTIIACLIRFESSGPVLFRQKRYGVDGTEIDVLKFRSMYMHSDNQVKQATRNDIRVTRIGRILRSTSLDELPQLLNVLTGSMSLIGPRPHAVAHNELWRAQIKGYMLRHKVKPGITGWAQVHG